LKTQLGGITTANAGGIFSSAHFGVFICRVCREYKTANAEITTACPRDVFNIRLFAPMKKPLVLGHCKMSLAHTLIDSALAADLTQNELKIFLVLLRQTLCYGKSSDPLTNKRIATLAHIRKDRVLTAINGFLKIGIFQTKPHKIFETEYFINPQLLTQPINKVLAPPLPKNRNTPHFSESLPEKWVHTDKTITTKNLTTTHSQVLPTKPSTLHTADKVLDSSGRDDLKQHRTSGESLPYPKTFGDIEKQQAAKLLDGLSPTLASHCLNVLDHAIQSSKVRKPLAYLHQLVKAARNGTLDTSTLNTLQPPNPPHQTPQAPRNVTQQRLNVLASEIYGLDQLFKRAAIPMDALNAARRQQLVEEYQRLTSLTPL
jgi:phage replication O-like protein O